MSSRVHQRHDKNHHDQNQREPLRHHERHPALPVRVFDQQLHTDPRNDDERAVHNRRIALDERHHLSHDHPHGDDAENAAAQHHPFLRRHGDRRENRIDRKDEVGQLDLHHCRPERRHTQPGCGFRRRAAIVAFGGIRKVFVGQVEQVTRADQLHDGELNQVNGCQRRSDAEGKRADEPVFERLPLFGLRQPEHHERQHDGVVGAQQSFQNDEHQNGEQICPGEHPPIIVALTRRT